MKFCPLEWRSSHPHVVADRVEDLTSPEAIRLNSKCDRTISLYGYVRGTHLKSNSAAHIPGCGDFTLSSVSVLPDPCPLPEKAKKRSLNEKEKLIYAPMAGVGGIVYDKDAVYIDLGGSHAHEVEGSNKLVASLMETRHPLDAKMKHAELSILKDAVPMLSEDVSASLRQGVDSNEGESEDRGSEVDVDSDEGGRKDRGSEVGVDSDEGESEDRGSEVDVDSDEGESEDRGSEVDVDSDEGGSEERGSEVGVDSDEGGSEVDVDSDEGGSEVVVGIDEGGSEVGPNWVHGCPSESRYTPWVSYIQPSSSSPR